MNERPFDVLIVGAGLGGLLSALRLSSERPDLRLALTESRLAAGGRLVSGGGQATREVTSGLPLEVLGRGARALLAEVRALLSPSEQSRLGESVDIVLPKREQAADGRSPVSGPGYVIRKEFTPMTVLLGGSSECLTRHGAQALEAFLNSDETGVFKELNVWKALRKPQRDELRPFFETLAGTDFEMCMGPVLRTLMRHALCLEKSLVRKGETACSEESPSQNSLPVAWEQATVLELAQRLASILEGRGVSLYFGTKLEGLKIDASAQSGREVRATALRYGHAPEILLASRAIVTLPLSQALTLVERDVLTAAESRFVTKQRPRSAMVLEIERPFEAPEFCEAGLEVNKASLEAVGRSPENIRLFFPVERVQGFRAADGRLILYAFLDYEVSMQAPSVRDALARIKRALRRVLPQTELEIFARVAGGVKGAAASQGDKTLVRRSLGERVVLVPVAQSVSPLASQEELPQCSSPLHWNEDDGSWTAVDDGVPAGTPSAKAKSPRLFFTGEHFRECHEAWWSLVESGRVAAAGCADLQAPSIPCPTQSPTASDARSEEPRP